MVVNVFLPTMQKLKLMDNMTCLLAGLATESYKVLQQIFNNYAGRSKSSKKIPTQDNAKPDCHGSNFYELRNLDSSTVHSLLVKVQDGLLNLNHLNMECKREKWMHKLKQTFASEVGVETREQAVQAYPRLATEAALECFLAAPSLSGPNLSAFQQYCSKAVHTAPLPQVCRRLWK